MVIKIITKKLRNIVVNDVICDVLATSSLLALGQILPTLQEGKLHGSKMSFKNRIKC